MVCNACTGSAEYKASPCDVFKSMLRKQNSLHWTAAHWSIFRHFFSRGKQTRRMEKQQVLTNIKLRASFCQHSAWTFPVILLSSHLCSSVIYTHKYPVIPKIWFLQGEVAYPLWKRSTLWNLCSSTENSSVPCTSDMIRSHSSPVKREDGH